MFDVGGGELILIVLAILVLFGPDKMPEIARMMKKGMAKVNQAKAELQSQLEDIKENIDLDDKPKVSHYQVKPVVMSDFETEETATEQKEDPIKPEVNKDSPPDKQE